VHFEKALFFLASNWLWQIEGTPDRLQTFCTTLHHQGMKAAAACQDVATFSTADIHI
jgi:hypothetical protein